MLRPQLADTRIPLNKHCPRCKARGHIQLVTHGTKGAYGGNQHGAYVRCWNSHPGICHCGSWFAHNGVDVTAAVDAAILAWNEEVAIAMPPLARPDYQQRVIDEKAELGEKLNKLNCFIESGSDVMRRLPPAERGRLLRQESIMGEYSEVLGERIAAFPPPPGADATTAPTP